ncbi:MAG: hypothetical protein Q9164_005132 [Protoblastenia rupestris]
MAPPKYTQHDPNLKEPKRDELNNFNPLDVFGYLPTTSQPSDNELTERWKRLTRIVGRYRDDLTFPYNQSDINRAKQAFRATGGWQHVINTWRRRHQSTWNPTAGLDDRAALLRPVGQPVFTPKAVQTSRRPAGNMRATTASFPATQANAYRPPPTRSASPPPRRMFSTAMSHANAPRIPRGAYARTRSPQNNPHTPSTGRRHVEDQGNSDDDDVIIVSSRSNVGRKKDPVSEVTKREIRLTTMDDDEERSDLKARIPARKKIAKEGGAERSAAMTTGGGGENMEVIRIENEGQIVYMGSNHEIPNRVVVGNDRRRNTQGRFIVVGQDSIGRGYYHALEPTGNRAGEYRLERASYDDVIQLPAMITALRNSGQIALAHLSASRAEILVYFRQVMRLRRLTMARQNEREFNEWVNKAV